MAVATAPTAAIDAVATSAQVRCWRNLDLPLRLLSLSMVFSLASAAAVGSLTSSTLASSSRPSPTLPQTPRNRQTGINEGTSSVHRILTTGASASSTKSTDATSHGRGESDIIFPDSQFKPRFNGPRPNCAQEGSTYCEEGVEGYPMVHLNQVLDNIISYREYFGNDTLGQDPQLVDRFGPDGESAICGSKEQIIFPKMGQNADGQWLFIVNQENGNYKQGVRVEICETPDTPCQFANSLPTGVNAVCRQKYIYRRLVAVGEAGETVPDSFRIPSCCACFINSDVTARIISPTRTRVTRRVRRSKVIE